jgi:pimeloyl-ACP methyl ester carboxylesterase
MKILTKNYLWTKLGGRLQLVNFAGGKNYNWIFIPGGPGFGSESLSGLVKILNLPGAVWLFDFPGDGSNTTTDDAKHFSNFSKVLVEITKTLSNVILVAHSVGGMYVLATPMLEKNLAGLVLMDTAPDSSWYETFLKYFEKHPIASIEKKAKNYAKHPSNKAYKEYTITLAPVYTIPKNLKKIIALFDSLPFNYKPAKWSWNNFQPMYKAKWTPRNIPTLILAGDEDHVTPIKLFIELHSFKNKNILIQEIKNAGHFPWIDNPDQVCIAFENYTHLLEKSSSIKQI